MAPRYEIHVYNRSGVMQARFTDFQALSYTKEVNGTGLLEFVVEGTHAVRDVLELDGQVEVRRSDPAIDLDWYTDFYGLYRAEIRRAQADQKTFTARCPGLLHFFQRSIIAYPAETASRSKFTSTAAETILKTLATYNATSSGTTADGRERDVGDWGDYISVEADGAGGSAIDEQCAWRPLLATLQTVADKGGLDFQLVKTAAEAWEFRTDTLLGTDKSASVVFSLDRGNMDNVEVKRNDVGEVTVAIVGGQGTESSRTIVTRTGANYQARYNSYEAFVGAQQYSTTAGLQAAGDARLEELEARDQFDFTVRNTDAVQYGRDWDLGDLITAVYEDISETKKIRAVTVTVQPDASDEVERIQPRLVTA